MIAQAVRTRNSIRDRGYDCCRLDDVCVGAQSMRNDTEFARYETSQQRQS